VSERYEVVVTTAAGLYRYRLGDVVEVVGHHEKLPVIEFLYRRGGLLNVMGEKTSELAALEALGEVVRAEGLGLVDFSTRVDADASPPRYLFYVELEAEVPDVGRWAGRLEEALGRTNPRYAAARAAGKLGTVGLCAVAPGTFRELRGWLVQRGASPTQVKVPRLLPEGEVSRFVEERLLR